MKDRKEPCCSEWEDGIQEIDSFITTANVRAGVVDLYKSSPFSYCPWCGTKLEKDEENEK